MATDTPSDERRQFSRIPFQVSADLESGSHQHHSIKVIDISLNGLLIEKPSDWNGKMKDAYKVTLRLEGAEVEIDMRVSVAHIDDAAVGFNCEHIDLDSITHLKRLVELNLGDEALLTRELSALIH
jgi:hypothetical protein